MTALLGRDLALALRAGGGFGLGLAFFLILAVLVPLGVGADGAVLARIAPGIVWVAAPRSEAGRAAQVAILDGLTMWTNATRQRFGTWCQFPFFPDLD